MCNKCNHKEVIGKIILNKVVAAMCSDKFISILTIIKELRSQAPALIYIQKNS